MRKLRLLTLLTIFCSLLTTNTLLAQITQPTSQVSTVSEGTNYEMILSEKNANLDANNYNATHKPVEDDDDDVDFSVTLLGVAGGRFSSNHDHNNKETAPELFNVSLYADGNFAEHNTYIGHNNTSENNVNIINVTLLTDSKSTESLGTFTGTFPINGILVAGKVYTINIQYQVGLTGQIQTRIANFSMQNNSKTAANNGISTSSSNAMSTFVASAPLSNLSTHKYPQTVIESSKAFPNPFNEYTVINYYLEEDSPVTINIYNNLGQLVTTIINHEYQMKGKQSIRWNSRLEVLSKGVYYCNIQALNQLHSIKLVKTK